MLRHVSLTQLACRASNLAERLFLLKQLAEFPTNRNGWVSLSSSDLQAVQEDLEMLFPAAADTAPYYRMKRQTMKRSLRLYRWYERNIAHLSAAQQQLFLLAHKSWLQTYEQAIATSDLDSFQNDQDSALLFRACGLAGCAPFMKLIETELTAVFGAARRQGLEVSNELLLIKTVQQFFWQRIGTMVASIEERFSGGTSADAPIAAETYITFYLKYPVLARWLSQVCGDIIHFIKAAIARLLTDRHDISASFWADEAITQLMTFRLRQEDVQGQWTMLIDFRLADGQARQMVYYPYALEAELGLQNFYAACEGNDCDLKVSPYTILCRSGYGYIASNPSCATSPLAKLRQVGQALAMRQLLGHRGLWGRIHIGVPRAHSSEFLDVAVQENAMQQGFESCQRWFRYQSSAAMQALSDHFAIATAQLCHRSPGAYLLLLMTAQQSAYLTNPLAVDAVFRVLVDRPCPWDSLGEIAQLEVKMLWQFKALCLTVPMNHRYMLYDAEHALFSKLPLAPLEFLARRIAQHANQQNAKNIKAGASDHPLKADEIDDSISFEFAMNS
jgi:Domain of unknown function (DUF4135)